MMTRRTLKRLRRQVGSLMARLGQLEAKEPTPAAPAPAAKPASAAKKKPAKKGGD
jgi:hypothetical protein